MKSWTRTQYEARSCIPQCRQHCSCNALQHVKNVENVVTSSWYRINVFLLRFFSASSALYQGRFAPLQKGHFVYPHNNLVNTIYIKGIQLIRWWAGKVGSRRAVRQLKVLVFTFTSIRYSYQHCVVNPEYEILKSVRLGMSGGDFQSGNGRRQTALRIHGALVETKNTPSSPPSPRVHVLVPQPQTALWITMD